MSETLRPHVLSSRAIPALNRAATSCRHLRHAQFPLEQPSSRERLVSTTIVNYGMGNVGSVANMVRRAGGEPVVTSDPATVARASRLILPGVGSFDAAMARLSELDLLEPLGSVVGDGVPILGICLGMQLLADYGDEGGVPGLGWIPGKVTRLTPEDPSGLLRIPHIGWNGCTPTRAHPLFVGVAADARFYFVHSFHFECSHDENELGTTTYGGPFTSAVGRDHVVGVQFHPEKSHAAGRSLIQNFLNLR